MERIAIKRPLESEGIPPLIEDPEEALEIFGEILKRGAMFYPDANEFVKVCRIIPLAES